MKNFIILKSRLLLVIYGSYLGLSCVPEKDDRTLAVETTIMNIQKRLQNRDYPTEVIVNPRQDLKMEMKQALRHIEKRFDGLQHPKFRRVNSHVHNNGIFKFTSLPNTVDEFQTFGIDDPANFDLLVNETLLYYNGVYTYDQVVTSLTNLNNQLLNYPYTYSGADQFLLDQVNNGNLTDTQAQIIRIELEAITNASSVDEITNIISAVNQEILNSQLTYQEQNTIYTINAGIETLIESEAIAMFQNSSPYSFTSIGAMIGITAAIAIVGVAFAIIGSLNDNDDMSFLGMSMIVIGWGWLLGLSAQ
jgi:hypothetical protein